MKLFLVPQEEAVTYGHNDQRQFGILDLFYLKANNTIKADDLYKQNNKTTTTTSGPSFVSVVFFPEKHF